VIAARPFVAAWRWLASPSPVRPHPCAPGSHSHFCCSFGHDHRWRCTRRMCLLGDVASCAVCRCGRELRIASASGDAGPILECPLRGRGAGHDARILPEVVA
jgi:hypothetical protein